MAIKEDLTQIKQEIGAQEQFLESMIKGERFFRKYKKFMIIAIIVAVVAIIGFYSNKIINDNRIEDANLAYSKLILNPNDANALNILKEKEPNLYALFSLQQKLDKNETNGISELANLKVNPIVKDIILSQNGNANNQILSEYSTLLKGFELLKQNKIKEANDEFNKISLDSQLQTLVKNLKHYQGIK
ncbi:hypothetical protein [Campylobacter concisus]|uniref:Tetratricopeptide repeat-like domain-containing protein n=1 Tax=Campylobacter concisus TaxID=199 RepID=A0AAE7TPC1_9BACT|nr:hypothetical protein [Campylobacter concisus]QPH86857.1 hypothetical protein CVT17_07710 [Campylobacter concisus]